MIVLDTDHVSVLRVPGSPRCRTLAGRLALVVGEIIGIPIVAAEETMRGWLSALAKERHATRQVYVYRELADMFTFFAGFTLIPFDASAAALFDGYGRIRIGTSDRKIAATAVAHNALLLTANRRDFELIPGLRFENWLE